MSTSDLENKLADMNLELTKSQEARVMLQTKAHITLLNFLEAYVEKMTSEGMMETLIEDELIRRVSDDDEHVSTKSLIEILKIFKDNKTSGSSNILNILKENTKVVIEQNNTNPSMPQNITPLNNSGLSKEQVKDAVELMDFLQKIKKTEFSPEEVGEEIIEEGEKVLD